MQGLEKNLPFAENENVLNLAYLEEEMVNLRVTQAPDGCRIKIKNIYEALTFCVSSANFPISLCYHAVVWFVPELRPQYHHCMGWSKVDPCYQPQQEQDQAWLMTGLIQNLGRLGSKHVWEISCICALNINKYKHRAIS